MERHKTCQGRILRSLARRIRDLGKLWRAYLAGDEERYAHDLGTLSEYGLAFYYVPPVTFCEQKRGYFCYQLSWGGPADEFRFFCDENFNPVGISYVLLDWFDGAEIGLQPARRSFKLLESIFIFFKEVGEVKRAAEAWE